MTRVVRNSLVICLLLVACLTLGSCKERSERIFKKESENRRKVKQLQTQEIRDYQGKKLSSVNEFRENSIKGPQHIDKDKYQLKLGGLVKKPQSLSYDEVIKNHQHYKKVVTLHCVEGWSVTILWEGILVKGLLKEAGVKPEAKIVIFKAKDGYSSSLPLDYIKEEDIIMAYKMNNIILPEDRGFPFQLVAEDKLGYKWVKWITEIELSADETYKGYWESRGYSNEADVE